PGRGVRAHAAFSVQSPCTRELRGKCGFSLARRTDWDRGDPKPCVRGSGCASYDVPAMSPDGPDLTELSEPCPEKTRSDLEWDRVLAALAERCTSEIGKAAALELPFRETRAGVRRAAAEGRDALALRQSGEAIPVASLPA